MTQLETTEKDAEKDIVQAVRNVNGSTRIAYRAPSGMFKKKAKAPTALEVQEHTAALLTAVSPEKPESAWEVMTRSMIELASNPSEKTANASVKAYEALQKAAGFAVKPEDTKQPFTVVFITPPDLPCQGELQERKQLKPSFANTPYIDAEILHTNAPQVTAADLQKDHEAKPKEKPEKMSPICDCATQSPAYCPVHSLRAQAVPYHE